ncbi:uncharacterized protein PgNI_01406 [Pyricularia grisea]|uniref:Uncharacterized protein n=1 Tax=Pyricularia grisea TaxID=148305 RepID=A0A6P8BK37_PYRGI|nr:uncharacterized protein PgNI_01406 [Pyricularia grisea]TLD17049.1 hypothetical protein PgNI_01406 [Pyricularia grisea]
MEPRNLVIYPSGKAANMPCYTQLDSWQLALLPKSGTAATMTR